MKVREKQYGHVYEVFGIYWQADRTYFCCLNHIDSALNVIGETEAEVTDAQLGPEFVFHRTANQMNGVFHVHLLADSLLDRLLEYERAAYDELLHLLGRAPP
jgi:hypothetical protein